LLTSYAKAGAPIHRTSRPPMDPVNAALSFGYGMLRVAVHGALEQVGLDPYLGFLHGVRPGKPSLALDMMEEFRALLVDRVVFSAFNQRQLTVAHFETTLGDAVRLTDDGRRIYLGLWSTARSRDWRHSSRRSEVAAALLPLLQARLLARYLRGDISQYLPWEPM